MRRKWEKRRSRSKDSIILNGSRVLFSVLLMKLQPWILVAAEFVSLCVFFFCFSSLQCLPLPCFIMRIPSETRCLWCSGNDFLHRRMIQNGQLLKNTKDSYRLDGIVVVGFRVIASSFSPHHQQHCHINLWSKEHNKNETHSKQSTKLKIQRTMAMIKVHTTTTTTTDNTTKRKTISENYNICIPNETEKSDLFSKHSLFLCVVSRIEVRIAIRVAKTKM